MITAGIAAITAVSSDVQAGRKLPDQSRRAGLAEVTVEAEVLFVPLTNPRMAIWLESFGAVGPLVETVRAAQGDAANAGHTVRFPAPVGTVGRKTDSGN